MASDHGIPLSYRKITDDAGWEYRANYTSCGDGKYLLRVAMVHPDTHRLLTNADFGNTKGAASAPYYLHSTCASLEECFQALGAKQQQLAHKYRQQTMPCHRYACDRDNQTLWSAFEEFEADFFVHQKNLYWHASSTLKNYRQRYQKMRPTLEAYLIGDLNVAESAQSLLDALSTPELTPSAVVLNLQLLAQFARYLSARLLVDIHPLLLQQFSVSSDRTAKIRAAFGVMRSLSEVAIAAILQNAIAHPEEPAAFCAALNLFAGLRTAECAALCFGTLQKQNRSHVFSILIHCQLVGSADNYRLEPRLKTDAAYRDIVLPTFLVELWHKRQKWVQKRYGYNDRQDSRLPLFFRDNNPAQPILAGDLAAKVKSYLQCEICVSDEAFAAFQAMQQYEQLRDDRGDSLSFYLLRRTAISLWHTRILLPDSIPAEDAICYLSGHSRTRAAKKRSSSARPTPTWQTQFLQAIDPRNSKSSAGIP